MLLCVPNSYRVYTGSSDVANFDKGGCKLVRKYVSLELQFFH